MLAGACSAFVRGALRPAWHGTSSHIRRSVLLLPCLQSITATALPQACHASSLASPPTRAAAIGIPLTMRQLAAEGLPSLVARLVGRRHYLLAMRICQALGLSTEEVRVVTCQRLFAASSFVGGAWPRAGAVVWQDSLAGSLLRS